jgi:Sugar (and other) transporter
MLFTGTPVRWPFLLGVEVVPAVVAITLWFLPDSPRYLLLIKRQNEAAKKGL